jgi:8-oxo-dGTP diphosphatase
VVHRPGSDGTEIALVHRKRYDDWSLPKGKLHPGEAPLLAALREVGEEIGAKVALERRLARVGYEVDGAPKTVDYWSMRFVSGDFSPSEEVDELTWVPLDSARARVSYRQDRDVLDAFRARPTADSTVVLVRHARAGDRKSWRGEDSRRPLDASGRAQAQELASVLLAFGPSRVVSADRVRCRQTITPLAEDLGLEVEVDSRFDDEQFAAAPGATHERLTALARLAGTTVVCSQGYAIPAIVEDLGLAEGPALRTRKGGFWVLGFVDDSAITADYYRTTDEPR